VVCAGQQLGLHPGHEWERPTTARLDPREVYPQVHPGKELAPAVRVRVSERGHAPLDLRNLALDVGGLDLLHLGLLPPPDQSVQLLLDPAHRLDDGFGSDLGSGKRRGLAPGEGAPRTCFRAMIRFRPR
jgi:hypothetical protein